MSRTTDAPESDVTQPPEAATSEKSQRRHIADLVEQIHETIGKFERDGASRGDMKIVARSLRELRYAFKVFDPYRRRRKVAIFGSARTQPEAPTYQQAKRLGEAVAKLDWLVITGAAAGIMEAGHEGAGREHSMGLNILLPFEQEANPVIAGDEKLVHMKYFFTRKLMFVKECDALVCLAGGFGTLDEAMEVLTLLQTGKRDMVPVILLEAPRDNFWQPFHTLVKDTLLARGMISEEDLSLYRITDSCDAAIAEITNFYRVYHSMRFAREKLVFRLNEPLGDTRLERINQEFADILAGGRFELSGPLSVESDEPDLADLPRLVFQFNRRNLGRLRQLINVINEL